MIILFVRYNANPENKNVGDCTVRAISKLLGKDWQDIFIDLMVQGLILCDMPSANHVWGSYLKSKGYCRNVIPNDFPDDYSVEDFCKDNPKGSFLLALPSHVVAVKDGNFYDTWDSRHEVPLFYWEKKEGK